MFVNLTKPGGGRVMVNANQIRYILDLERGSTRIYFEKEHTMIVSEPSTEITAMVSEAMLR